VALAESLERRILAPVRRGLNEEVFMSDTAELETKLAFVEETVRALDAALATQQQHMLQLQQELEALRIRLREQGTRLDAMTPVEPEPPPPHY
jgi:uncharacterized coiled-coil protein SlyX